MKYLGHEITASSLRHSGAGAWYREAFPGGGARLHAHGAIVEAFMRAGAAAALDGPGGPRETTAYLGRAVVALTSDGQVFAKSGQLLEVGTLALEYGFTDVDGSQPPPFRVPSPP